MNDRRKDDQRQTQMYDWIQDIYKTLNGKEGLVVETALNKQAVKRAWKVLYFLLFCIVGLAVKVVAF